MSVTIELRPDVEARAKVEAKASGVAVEEFLSRVIETTLSGDEAFYETASFEEWEAALDAFADRPAFDKAIGFLDDSRESIYREREDSQL